jgi:hypothetical protein
MAVESATLHHTRPPDVSGVPPLGGATGQDLLGHDGVAGVLWVTPGLRGVISSRPPVGRVRETVALTFPPTAWWLMPGPSQVRPSLEGTDPHPYEV